MTCSVTCMAQCTEMLHYMSGYLSPVLLVSCCFAHGSSEYKTLGIRLFFTVVYISGNIIE